MDQLVEPFCWAAQSITDKREDQPAKRRGILREIFTRNQNSWEMSPMSRDDQPARRRRKRRQKAARARPADLEEIFGICVNRRFGFVSTDDLRFVSTDDLDLCQLTIWTY